MATAEQHELGPGVFKDGNPLIHAIHRGISAAHLAFACKPLPDRIAIYFHQLELHERPRFKEAVQWLQSEGYEFVKPDEYLKPGGKKAFLSFDDNHHFWWECLPLFEELGIPVTFYTNSGVFREEASDEELNTFFNRIGWFGERKTLTRQELKEVAAAGHVIAAHTHRHPALQQISESEARDEIRLSQQILSEILEEPVTHFSFPYGMPRFLPAALRDYCLELGMSVADATPAMLNQAPQRRQIHRTFWRLELSLQANIKRLQVDGRFFVNSTGKSAIF